MTAYLGQGATITIDSVAVGQILSIDGPTMERTMVDTTNLGTTTLRTFVPGFGDGGELTIEAQFDNDDAGQQDILESFEAGSATAEAIVITTSDSDTFSFNAYIRSFSISQNMDEVNRVNMVLKVTGDVTHASA
tara:strand:- start:412 stop:813 length:402 start_codon:yes stop_codon:yes gene_type:complete